MRTLAALTLVSVPTRSEETVGSSWPIRSSACRYRGSRATVARGIGRRIEPHVRASPDRSAGVQGRAGRRLVACASRQPLGEGMGVRRLTKVFCIALVVASCSQPTTGTGRNPRPPRRDLGLTTDQEPRTTGAGSSSTAGSGARLRPPTAGAIPAPNRLPLRWVRSDAPNLSAGTPGVVRRCLDPPRRWLGGRRHDIWSQPQTEPNRVERPHGTSWRRAVLKTANGGRLLAVASTGNVLVAAGQTGRGQMAPVCFVRRGGGALRRVTSAVLRVPGGLRLFEAAAGPGGFIVIGTATEPGSDPWVVLRSDGGRAGARPGLENALAASKSAEVSSVTVSDRGILVAGTVQAGGRRRGTIWRKSYGGRWRTEELPGTGTGSRVWPPGPARRLRWAEHSRTERLPPNGLAA